MEKLQRAPRVQHLAGRAASPVRSLAEEIDWP